MAHDGQVVINTRLDDKGLKQGITGLQDTTITALNKVKGVLAAAGIGVGVAATVKSINNMIKSTVELTDRIDKQSQRLGMSRRSYQEWGYIMAQNDINVDNLQMSIKTLSTAVDEANQGNQSYIDTLKRLGFEEADVARLAQDQENAFNEVFTALIKVEDGTKRSAIASRLLGRAASELAPVLNGGSEAIEELRERAYDLGLVLDDNVVNIGVRLGNAMTDMSMAMKNAAARSIAPLIDKIEDLALSFIDTAIPAIEGFLSTAFKVGLSVPPIFTAMKAVITTVLKDIAKALEGPLKQLKEFTEEVLSLPMVQTVIDIVLNLAGDLWEGLKKGATTGDWSDFWRASLDIAEFTLKISTGFIAASTITTSLWNILQTAASSAGLKTAGFTMAGGTLAAASIAIAVLDAVNTGDFDALAKNVSAALITALLAVGLTGGNITAGILTFTVALNFKLGENLDSVADSIADALHSKIDDVFDTNIMGSKQFAVKLTEFMEGYMKGEGKESYFSGDLLAGAYDAVANHMFWSKERRATVLMESTEMGRAIAEGLRLGSDDEIKAFAEDNAAAIVRAFRNILGIKSPSTVAEGWGRYIVEGLDAGLRASNFKEIEDFASTVIDTVEDTLGIHSESEEGRYWGNMLIDGLISGLVERYPELAEVMEELKRSLDAIWIDQPTGAGSSSGGGGTDVVVKGAGFGAIWGDIKTGWKEAIEDMKKEAEDWTGFAKAQFASIPGAFGNAIGQGMRQLGQNLAQQTEIIQSLEDSILSLEDRLADSYEDLEDAQDAYSRAVLSGDSDAIKNAEKRMRQQERIISGHEKSLKALKEEKKSVEDGSKAWKDFARTILQAIANELYGLGAQLAARAVLATLTFNWAGAGLAAAASGAAFAAGILVDSWAGSFAEGGIVPQVAGVPSRGDQHLASVNPGELILNAAQQQSIAAQLAALARLTEIISAMSVIGSGTYVDLRGSTFNALSEEEVGKAIYRNIKTQQHEGVLGSW